MKMGVKQTALHDGTSPNPPGAYAERQADLPSKSGSYSSRTSDAN